MTTLTRHLVVDVVAGAPPITVRRLLRGHRQLELEQIHVVITPASTTTSARAAQPDRRRQVTVPTPDWVARHLQTITSSVDRSPTASITVAGVRLHVWLRSAVHDLVDAPPIPFGDARMLPRTVDVAEPGVLVVRGDLVARSGPTGQTVTRTYTARSTPPWLVSQLVTPILQDAR